MKSRFVKKLTFTGLTCLFIFCSRVPKLQGAAAASEPVWDSSRISVGRSGPDHRIRAKAVHEAKLEESPRRRRLQMEHRGHVKQEKGAPRQFNEKERRVKINRFIQISTFV